MPCPTVDRFLDLVCAQVGACVAGEQTAEAAATAMGAFDGHCDEEWNVMSYFGEFRYGRTLLRATDDVSVVYNCFSGGQGTPVHSHGNVARDCWIVVIAGAVKVTCYDEDGVAEMEKVLDGPGKAYAFPGDLGIHAVCNASHAMPAQTIHIFSPPYIDCQYKCAESGQLSVNPAIIACQAPRDSAKARAVVDEPVYTNFQLLIEMLRREIKFDNEQAVENGEAARLTHSPEHVEEMKAFLARIRINPREWRQYANFREKRYTRTLIGYDKKFAALLLCWEKGQMSPVHDHAGSSCWVKCLHGTFNERIYKERDGKFELESSSTYHEEQVSYMHDSKGVHALGNAVDDDVAVSLHIYSPAYDECNVIDTATGCKRLASITTAYGVDHEFMDKCPLPPKSAAAAANERHIPTLKAFLASLALVPGKSLGEHVADVGDLMRGIEFEASEWEQYVHFGEFRYTRSLLAMGKRFSLVLLCWNGGQATPIHDHGERNHDMWMRVLEGEVCLERFCPKSRAAVGHKCYFAGDIVHLIDAEMGLHRMKNCSKDSTAVTLHLYSPPYIECKFDACVTACGQPTDDEGVLPVVYCGATAPSAANDQASQICLAASVGSRVFSNIATLSSVMDKHLCGRKSFNPLHIRDVLQTIELHRKEWHSYMLDGNRKGISRNLLAYSDATYDIYITRFRAGQNGALHDHHGSAVWIKVIQGELCEEEYDVNGTLGTRDVVVSQREFRQVNVLRASSGSNTIYRGGNVVHKLCNRSKASAYAITVYSPPMSECTTYDEATGKIVVGNADLRRMFRKESFSESDSSESEWSDGSDVYA